MTAKKTPVTPARAAAVASQLAYQTMPRSVKIGCYNFRVELLEQSDAEVDAQFGHCNMLTQVIKVRQGMSAKKLANTFLHEVLHGIHWFHAIGLSGIDEKDVEETYTLLGTNGLCAFFQDNPAAAQWFMAANGSGKWTAAAVVRGAK